MNAPAPRCPELPAPPGRILLITGLALFAGIGIAVGLNRPRGPVCDGYLAARSTYVSAVAHATVSQLCLPEGAAVNLAAPLVQLKDDQLAQKLASKRREITALESELARTLAQAELELNWRMRTLDAEICDVQLRSPGYLKEKFDFELQRSVWTDVLAGREVAMSNDGGSLFHSVLAGTMPTPAPRMTTVLKLEAAANAAEVSAAQVEICELRQQRLEALKEGLPGQVRRMVGVDVAEANLLHAREELIQLEAQQDELTIASPAIGRVGVYCVRPGDVVQPGDPIVELLDDSSRKLEIHVPSRHITRFPVGTELSLVFPGGQRCTGRVTQVAPQAAATSSKLDSDPVILVSAEQTGRVWPSVPIGAQVKASPIQ